MRRRFILFDQNIRNVGGHFLELATVILDAAERAGFEPWLITHQTFGTSGIQSGADLVSTRRLDPHLNEESSGDVASVSTLFQLPEERQGRGWQFRPLMPHWKMHRWALSGDGHSFVGRDSDGNPIGSGLGRLLQNVIDRFHGTRPQVMLRDHAEAIVQILREVQPTKDDIALFGTCDEFSGLAIPLAIKAVGLRETIDIHLLYHSNFVAKRQGDWARLPYQQKELKQQFSEITSGAKPHRIHCWATTEELADQLNLLTASRQFSGIDYPIRCNTNMTEPSCNKPLPLRLMLGGAMRTEKGSRQIFGLLEQLWDSHLKPRNWQVVLQVSNRSAATILPRRLRGEVRFDDLDDRQAPILLIGNQLRASDYQKLITSADAGLFLYDPERYYARCSGVLVEMLASGIPVVVPAGSWLSRQIAPSIARYCSEQRISREIYSCVDRKSIASRPQKGNSILFKVSHGTGNSKCGRIAAALNPDVPSSIATEGVSIVCEVTIDESRGDDYVGFELTQRDIKGIVLCRQRQYCEVYADSPVRSIFQLSVDCTQASVCLFAPFRQRSMQMLSLRISQLESGETGGSPTGAVGLIAATNHEIPRLIEELTRHYRHYRQSALEHAVQWQQRHSGKSLVEKLSASQSNILLEPAKRSVSRKDKDDASGDAYPSRQ